MQHKKHVVSKAQMTNLVLGDEFSSAPAAEELKLQRQEDIYKVQSATPVPVTQTSRTFQSAIFGSEQHAVPDTDRRAKKGTAPVPAPGSQADAPTKKLLAHPPGVNSLSSIIQNVDDQAAHIENRNAKKQIHMEVKATVERPAKKMLPKNEESAQAELRTPKKMIAGAGAFDNNAMASVFSFKQPTVEVVPAKKIADKADNNSMASIFSFVQPPAAPVPAKKMVRSESAQGTLNLFAM